MKFLTIRRRGRLLVEALDALPADRWTRLRVKASGSPRSLLVHEDEVRLGKKRHPQLLAALDRLQCGPIPRLGNRTLRFTAAGCPQKM